MARHIIIPTEIHVYKIMLSFSALSLECGSIAVECDAVVWCDVELGAIVVVMNPVTK